MPSEINRRELTEQGSSLSGRFPVVLTITLDWPYPLDGPQWPAFVRRVLKIALRVWGARCVTCAWRQPTDRGPK